MKLTSIPNPPSDLLSLDDDEHVAHIWRHFYDLSPSHNSSFFLLSSLCFHQSSKTNLFLLLLLQLAFLNVFSFHSSRRLTPSSLLYYTTRHMTMSFRHSKQIIMTFETLRWSRNCNTKISQNLCLEIRWENITNHILMTWILLQLSRLIDINYDYNYFSHGDSKENIIMCKIIVWLGPSQKLICCIICIWSRRLHIRHKIKLLKKT